MHRANTEFAIHDNIPEGPRKRMRDDTTKHTGMSRGKVMRNPQRTRINNQPKQCEIRCKTSTQRNREDCDKMEYFTTQRLNETITNDLLSISSAARANII